MTLKEWHRLGSKILEQAGLANAPQEAKWLIAGALDRDPSFITLNPLYIPTEEEAAKIQNWLKRRNTGEPLSRLKGMREFWSLPFYLNEYTLDPRPDTEILIEATLRWLEGKKNHPWTILDLGTGSGCILISLLHELPHAKGMGVDIDKEALTMAHHNALLNKVDSRATFLQGNWVENVQGVFDIIVSNPPYIPLKDKDTLAREVKCFDPSQALFGGEDGLDCYRILAQQIKPFLSPHGMAAFEIGAGQRKDAETLFQKADFKILFVQSDLAGIDRVLGVSLNTTDWK